MNIYRTAITDEDDNLLMIPWDRRVEVGKHDINSDEPEPKIDTDYGFCCPNGCGDCEPKAMQFFTYVETNHFGLVLTAVYHKVWVAHCCPQSDEPLQVYDVLRDTLIGDYDPTKHKPTPQGDLIDIDETWIVGAAK